MSYSAIIGRLINVRKFPKADRIQLGNIFGSQVVTSINMKEDQLVVFFDTDGQLSEEFAKENNLFNKSEMNKDTEAKLGFFDHKRRVRCQIFRGEKSEGFVLPIESLAFTGVDLSTLVEGFRFTELNGVPICNKYITEATKKSARINGIKTQKGYNKEALKKLFPEHVNTGQLKYVDDKDLCGLITISLKLEGLSFRVANIKYPVKQTYKWYQKLFALICNKSLPEYIEEQQFVHGTRRVVKGQIEENAADFRSLVALKLKPFVKANEVWYGEIVGFEPNGNAIQGQVSTEQMPKDFRKRFGNTMTYSYGCLPNTFDFYIYRIAIKTDADLYELPWSQVKARCNNAGIKHVPEVAQFMVKNKCPGYVKEQIRYLNEDTDIADPIDPSHIKEGYVVRIEDQESGKTKFYKDKTLEYRILAGIAKLDENYIDEEESQGDI